MQFALDLIRRARFHIASWHGTEHL
jgi:hypothetical protein